LKAIVGQHPGHVRAVTLPGTSLEGRPFEGVEIAADVGRVGDGRPILLISGLTHAREWPSGEMAIEFAIDLAKTYAAGTDPRVTALLRKTRVFVFPMANPDGFVVSRQAGAAMAAGDDAPAESTLPLVASDSGAYKRKNCRAATPESQSQPCATRAAFGVDLNRAYSAYWGGDGSSSDPTTQQYRGPEPFSEPEAQAIRAFGQANQIQTYITFHTYTAEGRILRQPGFKIDNDEVGDVTPDEARMKALGDDMAASTQGISELGYATLGNITGPADDFLYYSQGTYGYTPELRGQNFHTGYANAVVAEYEGFGSTAGRGWREALIVAGEYAANTADHVVLEGTAPTGATLRLRKDFALPRSTDTDGDGDQDVPLETTPERIDATLTVPVGGRFEWHVNPSKRPYGPAEEEFTLTCEREGAVRATRTFTAARGERKTIDFSGCGPAATPTPGPTATPGPSGGRLLVGLRRAAFSARRANRMRGLRVRVVLRGPGSLRGVAIRLRDSRGWTVHRRKLGRVRATRSVRLERLRRVRAGRHRLVLTGRTASGAGVRAVRRVRVRR
jgi:murein tripeptide amidase MpaA